MPALLSTLSWGLMELITLHDIYKTYFLGEVDVPVLKAVSLMWCSE